MQMGSAPVSGAPVGVSPTEPSDPLPPSRPSRDTQSALRTPNSALERSLSHNELPHFSLFSLFFDIENFSQNCSRNSFDAASLPMQF
jgi:hypothetical protein